MKFAVTTTSLCKEGTVIRLPVAHAGGWYVAPQETIAGLNQYHRGTFRFCDEKGNATEAANPNGAAENITGVFSEKGDVPAMRPHPERAPEAVPGLVDGKRIFDAMVRHIEHKD